MTLLEFNCPHCQSIFRTDSSTAGTELACPSCHQFVSIPVATRAVVVPPAMVAPLVAKEQPKLQPTAQLACPICAGPFQVTSQMAGEQTKCPHCAQLISIPPQLFTWTSPIGQPTEQKSVASSPVQTPLPPSPQKKQSNAAPPVAVPKNPKPVSNQTATTTDHAPERDNLADLYPPGAGPQERAQHPVATSPTTTEDDRPVTAEKPTPAEKPIAAQFSDLDRAPPRGKSAASAGAVRTLLPPKADAKTGPKSDRPITLPPYILKELTGHAGLKAGSESGGRVNLAEATFALNQRSRRRQIRSMLILVGGMIILIITLIYMRNGNVIKIISGQSSEPMEVLTGRASEQFMPKVEDLFGVHDLIV